MKKIYSLTPLILVIAIIIFTSCSKTRDGLGLDTVINNAKTGKWNVRHLIYVGTSSDPLTDENLTPGSGYAEFKSNNKVYYYDDNGVHNESIDVNYSFLDTKSIIYDGDTYNIQENLVGTFKKMTLQRSIPTGREVYIFER